MAKPVAKRKQNGYKIPLTFPKGELLVDNQKNNWRLGTSIGSGGFGLIYAAQNVKDKKSNAYPFAVKIEPHENGPLFVEMQFYMRNAKEADVEKFMATKKISTLGMPTYIASGSHIFRDEKYRFLVMQKFGPDIWKLFLENNRQMPRVTVYKIGIQVLHALEYIHSMGYIHGDIKGANLLLGESTKNKNQIYLVDFGLACKLSDTKAFKIDPKRAHNGTIEYTSRDAHDGVPTRRGDIEILFYNLIHWFGGTLPWEKIKVVKKVQESKIASMDNMVEFLKSVFKKSIPDGILEVGKYILTLAFNEEPNYNKMHEILLKGLKNSGGTLASPLIFANTKRASTSNNTPNSKRKSADVILNGAESPVPMKRRSMTVDDIVTKKSRTRKPTEKANIITESNNGETLTAEMKRIKEKLDAKKAKRPATVTAHANNELVPVPSTSRAKASAGLKKKHIADALPMPKTRLVLENKDLESDEDAGTSSGSKRIARRQITRRPKC